MLETYDNPRQAKRRGNTKPPAKSDFFADMNEHASAEYRKPTRRHIVELERHGHREERGRVVVWEAVKKSAGGVDYYPRPTDGTGNTYVWDAVGSTGFVAVEDAEDAFSEVSGAGMGVLHQWCAENPYNGPRTPHDEHHGEEEGGQ